MQAVPLNANFHGAEFHGNLNRTTSIHPESLRDKGIDPGTGIFLRDYMLREEIIDNDEVKSPYAWFFWRYLTSFALIMGIVILALVHENKGALSTNQIYIFNSAIIMLTLMLGLNMTIAYSHFVMLVKAGILNKRPGDRNYWPFRYEASFAKISGLRSSIASLLSGRSAIGKTWMSLIFITMWLFFNMAMGVMISLIGLTYSLDPGKVFIRPGQVSVVDLSGFYSYNKSETITDQDAQRFSAKLYADISISYPEKTPRNPGEDNEFQVEQLGPAEWRYNFREMDHPGGVIVRSNRWINANTSCEGFNLIRPEREDDTRFYYKGPNGQVRDIGPALWDVTATYYLAEFTPNADLQPGEFRRCEVNIPRCAHVYVAQLVPDNDRTNGVDFNKSMIYICNSVIAKVKNAQRPEHEMSDDIAFTVGSSLAYSGMWAIESNNSRGLAYSMYPVRAEWGRRAGGNPTLIANMISRASIGTIAAMDQLNPRVYVSGMQPWIGEKLSVRWQRLIALLVSLAFMQLVGGVSSILWYRFQCQYFQAALNRENVPIGQNASEERLYSTIRTSDILPRH
ncbi:hypothetical protein EV426DRAFT_714038 [Tirmania nivea]|nr:hypothetical protein EV426DRAFT_714038 [Tirmania nivea]